MRLNQFLKSDSELAYRKLSTAQFLLNELLPAEIEDCNFEECIDLCLSAAEMFKEVNRMHQPAPVTQLHEIASRFLTKGIDVSVVARRMKNEHV
ncbi:YqaH family protein [Bacillus atrophaeus]|uniref:YqaH family protein n=1 Tax=Bacillus atrophaeus TaxID=1452 RepID=UPI002E226BD4|nr:YqaH family protein [Bacillus atrophaeus]